MDRAPQDLSAALDSLQELLLTAPEVETFLTEVAVLAAKLIEPAATCGITVHYGGEPLTVASSDNRAPVLDEEQYVVGEGPCLEALKNGQIVEVRDQRNETRWGDYSPRALAKGVRSSLSLPLSVDGRSLGALNLYSEEKVDAFSDEEIRAQAIAFAERASIALTLTIRYTEQSNTARQLEQALASRTVIDQAIGIIMAQQKCDAHAAFDLLRQHSQNHNRRLRDVAKDLITRVTGSPPVTPPTFEQHRGH